MFSHDVSTGVAKDAPIVTPLMEFIRQKRAAKSGPRVLFEIEYL
jgi:hypothetical protein